MNDKIKRILSNHGFLEHSKSDAYEYVFTKKRFMNNLVFLIYDLNEQRINKTELKKIVDDSRKWCKENVNAKWFINESGVNLVLLTKSAMDSKMLLGQTDSTGFHNSIVQSVTLINSVNYEVEQERTWVVKGSVKRVLNDLNQIKETPNN